MLKTDGFQRIYKQIKNRPFAKIKDRRKRLIFAAFMCLDYSEHELAILFNLSRVTVGTYIAECKSLYPAICKLTF